MATADIVKAITDRMNADAPLRALIGTRSYPNYDRRLARAYPLAVFKFEVNPVEAFDGPSGLDEAVFEIAAVAQTYNEAKAIGGAIRACLDGACGTWSGVLVQGVFLQDNGVREDTVVEPTTEEILYYVRALTFDVRYSTST